MAGAFTSRPLPVPPCPTYEGRAVTWGPWAEMPHVTHLDTRCPECKHRGGWSAWGTTHPRPGEMVECEAAWSQLSRHSRPRRQEVPARPLRSLLAQRCAGCGVVTVYDLDGAPVSMLLCDGCDVLCAAGSSDDEARASLVAMGGFASGGADWDLCLSCLPNAPRLYVLPRRA